MKWQNNSNLTNNEILLEHILKLLYSNKEDRDEFFKNYILIFIQVFFFLNNNNNNKI